MSLLEPAADAHASMTAGELVEAARAYYGRYADGMARRPPLSAVIEHWNLAAWRAVARMIDPDATVTAEVIDEARALIG